MEVLGKASAHRVILGESPTVRPAHPCAVPNCSSLVRGTSRCPTHTITREERNPKDPQQAKFYGSTPTNASRRSLVCSFSVLR